MIVKTMYHISLPKSVNIPPNKQFASLMTSHNKGIATANIIKANRMKKRVFKILPIAWYSITFYHKPPHNHTPHIELQSDADDKPVCCPGYKSRAVWHTRQ